MDYSSMSRQELETALRRAEAACARAAASEREQSELVATVSHELRTPMGAIISMSDLLLTTALDPAQRRYAETLQQSACGLLSVLNDILDYSRLGADKVQLEIGAVEVETFLNGIETMLMARLRDRSVTGKMLTGSWLPRFVLADGPRIRQLVNNLVDNAVKFTHQGEIVIRVDFDGDRQAGYLRFSVSDTGIGINADAQKRLFRPFTQANAQISETYGGSGLGLSIAKQLVQLMNGDIDVTSVEGRGSEFRFSVPVDVISAVRHRPRLVPMVSEEPADNEQKVHVLVVEDNHINRMLISAFLEKFGHSFKLTNSGPDALKALAQERFDVILVDVRMPGMDGIELTKLIRQLDGDSAITPVIAITAQVMAGDKEACLAAGMDAFISKPIEPSALYDAIMQAYDGARPDRLKPAKA